MSFFIGGFEKYFIVHDLISGSKLLCSSSDWVGLGLGS